MQGSGLLLFQALVCDLFDLSKVDSHPENTPNINESPKNPGGKESGGC